jgi:pimeloyl-ACP methyl ester carboxylesterase
MDYIARRGYDVYLVDLRGYGHSTRPPEMEKPAAENQPIVRTDVAVQDLRAAVDHILVRRGVSKLNLMGWSWGTAIMGRYATIQNQGTYLNCGRRVGQPYSGQPGGLRQAHEYRL